MPVRKRAEETQQFEYSYDEVLSIVKNTIDEEYGGIGKFLESEIYEQTGLGTSKGDKAKIYTYLANPEDKSKMVKSFPALNKIFSALYNFGLESKIEIIRTQKIISPRNLKPE